MTVKATSKAAAKSIAPVKETVREKILKYIKARGINGATIEEIANATGIRIQTVCARRNELDYMGEVYDSGVRRVTSSGRYATVWFAAHIRLGR